MSDLAGYIGDTTRSLEQQQQTNRYYGLYIGEVTDIAAPEGAYSIKVNLKNLQTDQTSWWCRVSTLMAGNECGFAAIPAVGEEVVVGFVAGFQEQPIVLGSLYGGVNKAIPEVTVSSDDVALKVAGSDVGHKSIAFKTRSGSHLVVDDDKNVISIRSKNKAEIVINDDAEKVQIHDKNRDQWLEVDTGGKKITIQTDTGEILIKAKETITMDCKNLDIKVSENITVKADKDTKWEAGGTIKEKSGGTFDIEAGGTLTEKAPTIDLNP